MMNSARHNQFTPHNLQIKQKHFCGKKLQRRRQATFKPFCPDKVCRWNTLVDVCKVKDNSKSNGKGTVLFQFFSEMGSLLVANTTLHSLLFEPQMVLRYETRGTQYWYRAQPAPRAHPCKHQHLPGKGGELTKATSPGGWVSGTMTKLCDKLNNTGLCGFKCSKLLWFADIHYNSL